MEMLKAIWRRITFRIGFALTFGFELLLPIGVVIYAVSPASAGDGRFWEQSSGNPYARPSDDPCDPAYPGYHISQETAMLAQQDCASRRQQQQQVKVQEQQQQTAAQQAQADFEQEQSQRQRATAKAITRGYEFVRSIKDLILDGKELAERNAKIQISGIYKKSGDTASLYASPIDAYHENDNFVPILTDDAQRALREYLMSYGCVSSPTGCLIDVGGHMSMCHHLSPLYANYPDTPCLNVEVRIVYRPGD
jgi:hypothetical protein